MLALGTDPLAGPYSSTVTINNGSEVFIRLNQVQDMYCVYAQVSISFGDGSPVQVAKLQNASVYAEMSHKYTTAGAFTITGTANINSNYTMNAITVNVLGNIRPVFAL
jgi:hypothetical protein